MKQEKRYACVHPNCDKVFNRRDYLDRHAANHLTIKPFFCKHCKRHFSRKDLYENHLNTRLHAKRVEELSQNKAIREESAAAKTRLSRINKAYPDIGSASTDESGSSVVGTAESETSSPLHVRELPATELEQPLLPLSGNGSYGGMMRYDSDFGADFSEINYLDNELTPAMLAQFHKPSLDPSPLVDYQDSDSFDGFRRKSLLYGLQREPQEPLLFARWSNYADPLEAPVQFTDDLPSATSSVSETARSSPSVHMSGSMPMRNFLLTNDKQKSVGSMATSSPSSMTQADTASHSSTIATSIGSSQPPSFRMPFGEKSYEEKGFVGKQFAEPPQKTDKTLRSGGEPSGDFYRNLLEPYISAAQHLQTLKTDTLAFQDSEKLQRVLREPPPAALLSETFNKQFLWFFDNHYGTPSSKVGYDHCYAQTNSEYQHRAKVYERENSKSRNNHVYHPLDENPAYAVLRILHEGPRELFDDFTMIDYYMHIAWRQTSACHYIVHLPTFEPSHAHPALLATLVVLGMALSGDSRAQLAAKTLYPSVLTAAYESVLDSAASSGGDRHAALHIGQLQAFTLLMRYEQLILGSDSNRLSLLHGPTSRAMIDRFLWVLLSSVHHWNGPQTPIWNLGPNHKPLWATVGPESYAFHSHCIPKLQWREWARYEMCKRTLHLALFCDNMHCLGAGSEVQRPVSIFNMDTHMISHEWLWDAWSSDEFFHIVGPSHTIPCAPYLGLIKSLIRFPRVANSVSIRRQDAERPRGTPPLWSLFSLRVLAYGLTNIVGRLSGVSENSEHMMRQVFNTGFLSGTDGQSGGFNGPWTLPLFDRSIQSRLYRGLDLWLQFFEETYGRVTERVFTVEPNDKSNGAVAKQSYISEDLAMIDLDDADEGIPGYVFIVVFYHYSSFLFVHEDLPVVLQVASNIHSWFETPVPMQYATLVDKLCIPLYQQWLQGNEAQAMLNTACMSLIWLDASMGRLPLKLFNFQFLGSATFIAVLVVWLQDLTRGSKADPAMLPPVRLDSYQFVHDAVLHLQAMSSAGGSAMNSGALGMSGDKIRSVILLAACMLYWRPNSERMVGFLMRLTEVLDPRLTTTVQQAVLSSSRQYFANRYRE